MVNVTFSEILFFYQTATKTAGTFYVRTGITFYTVGIPILVVHFMDSWSHKKFNENSNPKCKKIGDVTYSLTELTELTEFTELTCHFL